MTISPKNLGMLCIEGVSTPYIGDMTREDLMVALAFALSHAAEERERAAKAEREKFDLLPKNKPIRIFWNIFYWER